MKTCRGIIGAIVLLGSAVAISAQPPQRNDAISGFVDSRGYRVYFERHGAGPPMVLVHGWGADTRTNWVETGWVDTLGPHRTLIAIDIRGHGKSDKPYALEPYSYAAMSQDVLTVMDALDIPKADFMGYSMGSFMGAWLLGHHPERFTSMVLGGIGDETEESAAQGHMIAQLLRLPDPATIPEPARNVRTFVESNPDNDLQALAYSAEQMWPEGYPLDLAGDGIANARFPVLIVNGTDDHPYVDSADVLAKALPDGRHHRLPGRDHLTAVTDPDFKTVVVEFLTTLDHQAERVRAYPGVQ